MQGGHPDYAMTGAMNANALAGYSYPAGVPAAVPALPSARGTGPMTTAAATAATSRSANAQSSTGVMAYGSNPPAAPYPNQAGGIFYPQV